MCIYKYIYICPQGRPARQPCCGICAPLWRKSPALHVRSYSLYVYIYIYIYIHIHIHIHTYIHIYIYTYIHIYIYTYIHIIYIYIYVFTATPSLHQKLHILAGPTLGKSYCIACQKKGARATQPHSEIFWNYIFRTYRVIDNSMFCIDICSKGWVPGPPNPWKKPCAGNVCDPNVYQLEPCFLTGCNQGALNKVGHSNPFTNRKKW